MQPFDASPTSEVSSPFSNLMSAPLSASSLAADTTSSARGSASTPIDHHHMVVNDRPALRMVRGEGSYLWDEHGKRYLDFIQGWAVNCLGHSPPVIVDRVSRQMAQVLNVGPAFYNAPALELCERLAQASGLARVFLSNSGAEANEGAVKLCRKWGQKYRGGAYQVITTVDGFHGRTLAMTCATGKAGWDEAFPPRVEGFVKASYGQLEPLRSLIGPQTVAILVEPIQGEAGAVVPPDGYLKGLRELCDEHGLLLVLDEVQTGLGRTGPLFAFEHEGVRPDILTLGKGLGGGLPISALLASERAACFEKGDHGSTFGGNAVMSSAGLAVLDELTREGARAERDASSAVLSRVLHELARELGATVRGRGHLFGMLFRRDVALTLQRVAFELGLIINAPRPHILRFMPALNVSPEHCEEMSTLLREAARRVL
ncbi:MAG TPA: aminotransferase class III-fold pyridoxal phosphate-dependent enzyme [Polyangiaceae bacterium]|nr:aminotransferase class III-fold pyridoxal phosphate-dependent enzyme [Polyangiaceae bacterium]